MSDVPNISVVVASFSGIERLRACLRSFAPWDADVQVVVATSASGDVLRTLEAEWPAVRIVAASDSADVFRLRSLGIAQATGNLVVLTEDHCKAAPGWLASLREAFHAGHAVVGGTVDNGLWRTDFDWALFCCEYLHFMPPMPDGPAPVLSGVNVAYRRELLDGCRHAWAEAFHENEVHDVLRARGHALYRASCAGVASHLEMPLTKAMQHLCTGAQRFGRHRQTLSSPAARLRWILLSPVVPLVLLARILRRVVARHPRHLARTLRGMPYILCLTGAWSAGEAMGYWSGKGVRTAAPPDRVPQAVR